MTDNDSGVAGFVMGCGCFVIILCLAIGPVCFDYCLDTWFDVDIPWYGDAPCGWILSELVIPLALVTLIVDIWVDAPFFIDKAEPTTQPAR